MAKSDDKTEKTKPLFLRLNPGLIERLEKASEEYGGVGSAFDSANKVAADILDRYLDFWIQVKEREREELARQYQLIKNPGGSSPNPRKK